MQASAPGVEKPVTWYIRDVYTQRGVMGFYVGLLPSVTRAMLLNSTKLGTYDTGKHYLIDNGHMKDGKPCQFVASVISGFCMTCVTSPMDNIKTRIMSSKEGTYRGIIDCGAKMVRNEGGMMAFYRGFGPQWMRFAPFTTIQLLTWEKLRNLCGLDGI